MPKAHSGAGSPSGFPGAGGRKLDERRAARFSQRRAGENRDRPSWEAATMPPERDRTKELDAVMATVAAGIAHEVRNPLNAVQINLRILEEEVRRLEPHPTAQVHALLAKIGN